MKMSYPETWTGAAVGCLCMASVACAGVSIRPKEAMVGGDYTAILSVSGDCGGKSTRSVAVHIPDGFLDVEVKSKAGWKFRRVSKDFRRPHEFEGHLVTSGVAQLVWEDSNLQVGEYDEFVFRGHLARDLPAKTRLYFPVVQGCADGTDIGWLDTPDSYNLTRSKIRVAPSIVLRSFIDLRIHPDEGERVVEENP